MTLRVILASQSPRRRELLALVGIDHEVLPADINEDVRAGEQAVPYTERLAREKAAAIAARHPEAYVIAADTTVVVDGDILGKPVDQADARAMVKRLSGRSHTVCTGIAVAHGGRIESAVEQVDVTFRALSDAEIAAYVETGEPMDKAGAYGIQGWGATIVERVDGDYFSVMGLGLRRLVELFERHGVRYGFAAGLIVGDGRRG
ncbi:Maf family protein [Pseudogemmatithrix spongiicola]|uniref:dTTP/UTP pyrophosphatase n=1 Tax=Pseudogemmatithrix spongiicola TaxID=3062599 RepID=A0AA49K1E4_9BACT|nr:Maf family protein [Gemmatimonadaceae bacterium 'strain 138']WKW15709.1 Maf family protein [Gemmatimonadaceae bacterium 'strain 318']